MFSKNKNRDYYYNTITKESVWELPANLSSQPPVKEQVKASHILVKHKDSRRPSSWREVI